MQSDKLIIVDVDDTILDWTTAFKSHVEKTLNIKLDGRQNEYNMAKWIGLDENAVKEMVRDYNDNSEDFGKLLPTKKSEIYLPKLKQEGYDFVAITSCSDKQISAVRRTHNLMSVFGDIFYDVHCIPLGASKKELLDSYVFFNPHLDTIEQPFRLFVEDKVENAQIGYDVGHKSAVIRQPHNLYGESPDTDLIFVDDWEELYTIISAVSMKTN